MSTTQQQGKSPSQSAVETRYLVMPHQANPRGTPFGGVIVAWIDMVPAMAAQRHAGKEVVTAAIDSLIFKEPIRIGDQVCLRASVNYLGTTSMEVGVQLSREDPYAGNSVVVTTAHLTFVALDKDKKPTPVPPIVPQTQTEKMRYENHKLRVKARKVLLGQIAVSMGLHSRFHLHTRRGVYDEFLMVCIPQHQEPHGKRLHQGR